MKGYIYILSNPSFDKDIYKIGLTTRKDISFRLKELYTTSLPFPFQCEYLGYVEDVESAEFHIHSQLDYYRLNPDREFFKAELLKLIPVIEGLSKKNYSELIPSESCPWIYVEPQQTFKTLVNKNGGYLQPQEVLSLAYQTRIHHRIYGQGLFLGAEWNSSGAGKWLKGDVYFYNISDIRYGIDVSGASIITYN